MFLMAALALAQAVPSVPWDAGAQESDPILVVGERLKAVGLALTVNPITGKMKCKVAKPTGDPRIDGAACDIALGCARQSRRDRDRFDACMAAAREAFLDDYFAAEPDDDPRP